MRLACLLSTSTFLTMAACSDPVPNDVLVELSPDVVSSIDGTTTVQVLVIDDRTPLAGEAVDITVAYTDRNGVEHAIDPISGETDARGAFRGTLSGLGWEGTGTVTATVTDLPDVSASTTFSVLDRTAPSVEILPPTVDLRIGPGLPLEVEIHVTDEIGVSHVTLEAAGELNTQRSTVVASGATDSTVRFRLEIPDNALPGPTITLYALASDLSGNEAAAEPVVLTVDPAIAIATPPGLDGTLVTNGNADFLEDPRALAISPKDGMIYVADNSGNNPCNGGCIRKVDPATGLVAAGAIFVGNGTLEGIAFDANGDNLYYSDRQDRLGRLTWNGTTAYTTPVACNDFAAQFPVEPYHLVHDATLGVLVADRESQAVLREAACTGNDPTFLSDTNLDDPRGVALGAAGEVYVSDIGRDTIEIVDAATGNVSRFEDRNLDRPYGIDWLAGGTSEYADTLMVAVNGDRIVASTAGAGPRPTAYLRNAPIDVAFAGLTMYVLTEPSAGDRGRIFAVTGF